ncbi:MAG: xanthine dehydrogenase family protein molybdopterin-binding subunit [Candidatus Izemoplasmatales bacterium]|jgi:CO/xanthine dehydrogenase Mo-binding subunit
MEKDISVSVNKIDNFEKISGQARYVNDIEIPGALYAKTFRSPIVSGEIVSIKIPTLPQGYYIVDYRDVPGKNAVKIIKDDMPIFAEKTLRYYGEPILLIIGPDKTIIQSLINQIIIDTTLTEPIYDERNIGVNYHYEKGNPQASFAEANRIIEYTYKTGYQEQAYIEPQGLIGYPEGDRITLIGSMQCPYYIKNAVILALGCRPEQVRIIQPAVGGAFGGKEEFPSLLGCQLAVAVKKIQKPIRLIYEREEDIEVTTKRHPSIIRMKAAVDKNNNITAIASDIRLDGGAYLGLSNVVLSRSMIASTGAYTIPSVDCSGIVYLTNTVPTGAFRGFGAPQIFYAVEMFVNHIAKDLGIDPLEFKLKHLAKQGDLTSTSGTFRDPILMNELVKRALVISDYRQKCEKYQIGDTLRGMGISLFFHGCGFTGSGEATIIKAQVKLYKDEHDFVDILIAAVDMGQGVRTTISKIVANTLDIPLEKVRFPYPDTDNITDSGPTVASRTIMIVGGLVDKAAQKMRKEWQSGKSATVIENYVQPDYIVWDEATFHGDAYPAYSWGVNIVDVSVDKITNQVTIEEAWSVYDLGKAIDNLIIKGQAEGGITQGFAYGYLENMEVKNGKVRQRNLTDYIIPTALDVCKLTTELIDNPYAGGPYGAKGAGELTLIGGAPAVAMAIENAISRRVHNIPVTPESIMELIEYGNY